MEAPAEEQASANLSELLRAAQARLHDYVIQVLATVNAEDPASVKAAREALWPIAEAREVSYAARKSADAAPDAKPTNPAEPGAKPAAGPAAAKPQKPTAPQRPNAPPPA